MLRWANIKRKMAVCISLCLAVAPLVPTIALACEGGGTGEEVKTKVEAGGDCLRLRLRAGCELKLTATVELKLEETRLEEPGARERYMKIREGCSPGTVLRPGRSCIDEVEVIREVAGSRNKYCWVFKREDTRESDWKLCEPLGM